MPDLLVSDLLVSDLLMSARERTGDFAPAFARALHAEGPTVLELRIDREAVTPIASISQICAAARAADGG